MCLTPPDITTMGMGRTAGMNQKALFTQTQKTGLSIHIMYTKCDIYTIRIGLSIRMCTLHVIYYILDMYTKSDECITVIYIYVRCGRVQDTTHI